MTLLAFLTGNEQKGHYLHLTETWDLSVSFQWMCGLKWAFTSSVGMDLWRKEHLAYPKERNTCVINYVWCRFPLCSSLPTILTLMLLEELRFLKSLSYLMHLCQEKNMNVRCPERQTEQRESKYYLDLAEGEKINGASCCGVGGRFWVQRCMKALIKISTSLSLQPDMFFILVSGKTGTALGGPVKYSTNGEGKVIGPQVHITSRGAIYILFGFGKMHLGLCKAFLRKHLFCLKWCRASLEYFCHAFCCKS